MPRKTQDPVLIELLDKVAQAAEEFVRWYRRARRAFTGMEKARQKLVRLQRRIAQRNQPQQ